jgi:hypothetical protein
VEIDFENTGGETYLCGNPPYLGFTWQSDEQKSELRSLFGDRMSGWRSLDYVSAWFLKAADYGTHTNSAAAFVSTNSICQGEQVSLLWPLVFNTGHEIAFAHRSFKWANLASQNAGVTVVVVGISNHVGDERRIYTLDADGTAVVAKVPRINAYLVSGPNVIVNAVSRFDPEKAQMVWGNKPTDGGHLTLSPTEWQQLKLAEPQSASFLRPYYGSAEFIRGLERYCIWVEEKDAESAKQFESLRERFEKVRLFREASKAAETRPAAAYPHRFRQIQSVALNHTLILPQVSSASREYLPIGMLSDRAIVSNLAFALYDAPLWNMALIASRLHLVWIDTVCGKLKTDYRYSNTLGWNTFPVPTLTEANKSDLTRCAEDILLAREAHFPATIADLYDPLAMDRDYPDLRAAHDRNDETLERIYIGRKFRNDTERLEKLFELYTAMTATTNASKRAKPSRRK